MTLTKNSPFKPASRLVVQVVATNPNGRTPLLDYHGIASQTLTTEQFNFLWAINGEEGLSALINGKYLKKNTNGTWRLFPFVFHGEVIGIISEKGMWRQLLSLGNSPFDSEAYMYNVTTCNPSLLPHVFSSSKNENQVKFHIPLFQPTPTIDGSPNYWNIKLENTIALPILPYGSTTRLADNGEGNPF